MARYSKQREAVLTAVRSVDTHPTAREVYEAVRKEIPNISLGTVYRNLASLVKDGLIDELPLDNGSIRYDGNLKTHIHLTCKVCGAVEDAFVPYCELPFLESVQNGGFKPERGTFVLYGICKNCQKQ